MSREKQSNVSDWINSCVDQSLVSTSWKKTEAAACNILKQKLPVDELDPPDQKALAHVLGSDFMKKHFPHKVVTQNDDEASKKNEKKHQEMIKYVKKILESSAEGRDSKGKKGKFPELSSFLNDTKDIVEADYKIRVKQKKSKKHLQEDAFHRDASLTLLSKDGTLMKHVIQNYQKEMASLPEYLRLMTWVEYLRDKEDVKDEGHASYMKGRKKFLQSQKKHELYDSRTSIVETIEEVCKELPYSKTSHSRNSLGFICDIVTLQGNSNRKSQHNTIYWAQPMELLVNSDSGQSSNFDDGDDDNQNEDVATAAFVLEKILYHCSLTSDALFNTAAKVVRDVEGQDKDLIVHIKQCLTVDVPVNIKDFPSEILDIEKKRGKRIYQDLSNSKSSLPDEARAIIVTPEIFLRKWIHEGFVGILNQSPLLYFWDQLFLNEWSQQFLVKLCLALLGLLRPWFMICHDYLQTKKVFLNEPSCLYTLDIVKACRHTFKNGKFSDLAAINRNIYQGETPPTPKSRTPSPPMPVLPPPSSFVPWVPYEKEKSRSQMPMKTKVDHPFDIYIDSVRFVPDNATIIKVTGKILNVYIRGKEKSYKIQGYPTLKSPSRYPQFSIKQSVNKEAEPINPDVVLMLRVYTIEKPSKKQTVLGSCLFCPFSNKQGKQATLRTGGHQLRLRHGIPDPEFTVEHMLASHMDNNPVIPGVTILLRVLPYERDYISAPAYETHLYRSEFAKPNASETRIYNHYEQSKDFRNVVQDAALEFFGSSPNTDDGLEKMMSQVLDKEGSQVEEFPYQRFINYNHERGMMVLADKAVGLPIFLDGRYIHCHVQFFPGDESRIGNGKSQVKSFMTTELDLESTQRAPDWTDSPTRLTPEYDDRAYLLVTLYGLRPRYDLQNKRLMDKDGKELRFELQHAIAWSVVPCFDKQAVFAGTHIVPLFKGRPSDEVSEKLGYLPFDFICQKFKSTVKAFDTASIEITIWDGHFDYDESPPLPTHTEYLNISSNPKKYLAARKQNYGETILALLKQGMQNSSLFSQHQEEYLSLLKATFKDNMNRSLENSGYSKLI